MTIGAILTLVVVAWTVWSIYDDLMN